MSSSKTLIIGSVVVALVVAVFMATWHASPDALEKGPKAELRPSSRRLTELSGVMLENRPQAEANTLPDELRRDFDLQAKGYNAARAGMDAMVAGFGELKGERERESFLRGAFTCAADLGVTEALKWAWQIPFGAARDTALLTLYCKWSGRTSAQALNDPNLQGGGIAGALGTFLLKEHRATPEQVAAFTHDFVLGPRRVLLIADAAIELSATDPAKAFDLGGSYSSDTIFLERFATGWAKHDPQAVWQWAGKIPDPETRGAMQAIALAAMGNLNPATAAGHLQEMQLQGEFRAKVIERLATTWAFKDTKAALQWAETFPDAADRASAQKGIRLSAPVGIGVGVGKFSNNGFAVGSVLAGSPASRDGGLKEGDRIVAVKDANGNWLNSGDLNLMEFVGHLRGEPNTTAVLQVQGKDGGASRTVTITRQQLLLNP